MSESDEFVRIRPMGTKAIAVEEAKANVERLTFELDSAEREVSMAHARLSHTQSAMARAQFVLKAVEEAKDETCQCGEIPAEIGKYKDNKNVVHVALPQACYHVGDKL